MLSWWGAGWRVCTRQAHGLTVRRTLGLAHTAGWTPLEQKPGTGTSGKGPWGDSKNHSGGQMSAVAENEITQVLRFPEPEHTQTYRHTDLRTHRHSSDLSLGPAYVIKVVAKQPRCRGHQGLAGSWNRGSWKEREAQSARWGGIWTLQAEQPPSLSTGVTVTSAPDIP